MADVPQTFVTHLDYPVLPPGTYEMLLEIQDHGWLPLETGTVGEAETLDLGVLDLRPLGNVEISCASAPEAARVRIQPVMRNRGNRFYDLTFTDGRVTKALYPGSYEAVLIVDQIPTRKLPFEVRPLEQVEIQFDRE